MHYLDNKVFDFIPIFSTRKDGTYFPRCKRLHEVKFRHMDTIIFIIIITTYHHHQHLPDLHEVLFRFLKFLLAAFPTVNEHYCNRSTCRCLTFICLYHTNHYIQIPSHGGRYVHLRRLPAPFRHTNYRLSNASGEQLTGCYLSCYTSLLQSDAAAATVTA